MKKILVISDSILAETLVAIIADWGCEAVCSTHADALFAFATEDPSHVLISECESAGSEKTFTDISKSATNQHLIRCGFTNSSEKDYLRLPCNLKDLKQLLKI